MAQLFLIYKVGPYDPVGLWRINYPYFSVSNSTSQISGIHPSYILEEILKINTGFEAQVDRNLVDQLHLFYMIYTCNSIFIRG